MRFNPIFSRILLSTYFGLAFGLGGAAFAHAQVSTSGVAISPLQAPIITVHTDSNRDGTIGFNEIGQDSFEHKNGGTIYFASYTITLPSWVEAGDSILIDDSGEYEAKTRVINDLEVSEGEITSQVQLFKKNDTLKIKVVLEDAKGERSSTVQTELTLEWYTPVIYLKDGVVYCEGLPAGYTQTINGIQYVVTYTKEDAKLYAERACTSNMTDMSHMNFGPDFNAPIGHWDVSNVGNMSSMFEGATSFNQPLHWTPRYLAYTAHMFKDAVAFNQPVRFLPSVLLNMEGMFEGAKSFNSPVEFKNTLFCENLRHMFKDAVAFNQPVILDTLTARTMEGMFQGAASFNQPVEFNTENVTNMAFMFSNAHAFNQPVSFDAPKLTTVSHMFQGATAFNQEVYISSDNLRDVSSMFQDATSFNSEFFIDTEHVTTMRSMFQGATSFNQLIDFDSGKVTDMSFMFYGASSLNELIMLDTTSLRDDRDMFTGMTAFQAELILNANAEDTALD